MLTAEQSFGLPTVFLVLVVGVVVCVPIAMVWETLVGRRARKKRLAYLKARTPTSSEAWYDAHFSQSGISFEAASTMARLLAQSFGCDPTQLLPTDSFTKELGIKSYFFDEDDELMYFTDGLLLDHLDTPTYEEFETICSEIISFEGLVRWYDKTLRNNSRPKTPQQKPQRGAGA